MKNVRRSQPFVSMNFCTESNSSMWVSLRLLRIVIKQKIMDLFIFTKEILSGKLQFFCSDIYTEKKINFSFQLLNVNGTIYLSILELWQCSKFPVVMEFHGGMGIVWNSWTCSAALVPSLMPWIKRWREISKGLLLEEPRLL